MARNIQPVLKRCRTLGIEPGVMGIDKSSNKNPKQSRKKQSEYGLQLNEKQKVKFIYGLLEKQFKHYYELAAKKSGVTGEMLLQLLESRLDNVVFRLGFAASRKEARQLVLHRHFTVNGKNVDIASYQVNAGDVIAVKETKKDNKYFTALKALTKNASMPKWVDFDPETLTGKVIALPTREDVDSQIAEHMIVELYSK